MTIDDLMQQIEETERLVAVYRNANEVIVGTQDEIYSRRGLINRTTLTAAEIGDQVVSILERRLAAMSRTPEARRRISRGKPLIVPAGLRAPRRIASFPQVPPLWLHPAALGFPSGYVVYAYRPERDSGMR